jgi:hypothetical protein
MRDRELARTAHHVVARRKKGYKKETRIVLSVSNPDPRLFLSKKFFLNVDLCKIAAEVG